MNFIRQLVSLDPSIGKVDKSLLPQKALMELFIENMDKKSNVRNKTDDNTKWWGVQCDTDGNFVEIDWHNENLGGNVSFEWLPSTIRKVILIDNNIVGSLPLIDLPPPMVHFDVSWNAFTGSIDLTQLPTPMKFINVSHTRISGSVDLRHLPEGLTGMYLNNTKLSGLTDFSKLPRTLRRFDVGHTSLAGDLVKPDGVFYMTRDSRVVLIENR
mmetsp:Transcript_20840/g.32515  ORF Transcript_20840/g.32515 Transcript_20840/m.32515 type:complete len:213 (-) Transcript_20840:38-676(-)